MARCFAEPVTDTPCIQHSSWQIEIKGQTVPYTVLCEDTQISSPEGNEQMAVIFSYSYLAGDPHRPVMFIFNGGPGSSSTWLQMGFLAPRICVPDADGMPKRTPPFSLRDNPDCLLDLCDLVFYNPPSAGYSRLLDEKYADLVYGDHGDADAAGAFIRSWLKKHGEDRDILILGESFGSTRASLLADRLTDLRLKAVLHVGAGYTGDETISRSLKDLLPCAATNWYYAENKKELADNVQTWLSPIRSFLVERYLPALYRGSMLSSHDKQEIAECLSFYTGLPADYYMTHDLKVSRADFRQLRLKDKGLRIGSFDTRFTLPEGSETDPTLAALDPWITAGARLHDAELGLTISRSFRDNSFDEGDTYLWPFNAEEDMEGLGGNWYPMKKTVSASVADAWEKRRDLEFFFATGLYDTVATIENTRYAISHTRIPFNHVTLKEYESGHAVYADDSSRAALAADIRLFLERILHEPA